MCRSTEPQLVATKSITWQTVLVFINNIFRTISPEIGLSMDYSVPGTAETGSTIGVGIL
jgi:hypothetical protein